MESVNNRYFIYGQVCFYVGLIVCFLLKSRGLTANEGISYYGVFRLTILPYCFGLLGASYFCLKAALQVAKLHFIFVTYTFMAMSLLIVGIVITPDTLNTFVTDAHETIGSILFILQLLLSGWLVVYSRYNPWVSILSLLELIGGILSFIYLEARTGYLLESQVMFQASFGLLVIYSIPRFLANKLASSS